MSITSPASHFDPKRCPLCEQDNQCAVAAGNESSNCWCMAVKIDQQAKNRANTGDCEKRCLCQQCGSSF
ncbi:cysteine-rich CWC family protein [Zhongshania arctica]|uniref:Cysteine-rich CWC family protein n=1 Tax=Zhongshania arctica TaxID=3238302 RepID=A0ABV3TTM0_9GAMM